jgi:5-methylcytosine-specific restriction endonuclease McrA
MVTYNCEHCGIKVSVPPSRYNRSKFHYCSPECGYAHAQGRARGDRSKPSRVTTVRCVNCGKQFSKKIKDLKELNFCSRDCFFQYNHNNHSTVIENAVKKEKVKITCKYCGREFMVYPSRHKKQFCNRICHALSKVIPAVHIEKQCTYCGKRYKTTIHQLLKRDSKYCSKHCMNMGSRKGNRGAYSFYWRKIAAQIRKRDNNTCQLCSKHSTGRNLDVHHKRPARLFGDDYEAANRSENLITLCKSCHKKVEENPLLLTACIART